MTRLGEDQEKKTADIICGRERRLRFVLFSSLSYFACASFGPRTWTLRDFNGCKPSSRHDLFSSLIIPGGHTSDDEASVSGLGQVASA